MFSCVVRVVFVCLCSVLCALCSLCSVRGLFVCPVLCFSKNVSEGCENKGSGGSKIDPGGSKIHPRRLQNPPRRSRSRPRRPRRVRTRTFRASFVPHTVPKEPALPPHGAQRDPKWSIWGPFGGHFRCMIGLKESFVLSIPFFGPFWTILESILEELEVDF